MSEGDGSSPPARYGADMDLDALAPGTFKTPNGAADLLSSEAELAITANSANSAASPLSPPGPFAIDEGDEDTEDENELPPMDCASAVKFRRKTSQESVQSTGTIRTSFVGHLLKGGASMQPDDCSVASGSSKTSRAGEGQAKISVLSDKTSKIMSDYQSYLSESE